MQAVTFAEHLSSFVDVCREGSFAAAARRRGVTPSALIRQIDGLEADLGVTLFSNAAQGLSLTAAAQHLYKRAQFILHELVDTRAAVAALDGTVSGILRIVALPTFGRRYVLPAVERLMAAHPDLRCELDLTERPADPVADRLDAVIRMGELREGTAHTTRLAPHERRLVASPAYLARHGTPESIEATAGHRLLDRVHGLDLLGWGRLFGTSLQEAARHRDVFRCDDFEALRDAALRGLGIGLLPGWVVGQDILAGRLVSLLPEILAERGQAGSVYLLRALPEAPAKVTALIEALRAEIGTPPVWDRDAAELLPSEAALESGTA